jgi:geranylgeranyl pyrophosphate synthase
MNRCTISSLRDTAARAAVGRALDRAVASSLAPVDSAADVQTWRDIVDRPVVPDADAVSNADLYPPRAPRLASLLPATAEEQASIAAQSSLASGRGGGGTLGFASSIAERAFLQPPTLRGDEAGDHLDLSRFPSSVAHTDPFELIAPELRGINGSIKQILGIDHPVLATVAKYFFDFGGGGKKIRPALVLLMAHAVNAHESACAAKADKPAGTQAPFSQAIASPQDLRTSHGTEHSSSEVLFSLPQHPALPFQRRLAEVTEMIHTASLLHDDVIDAADTRRGVSSVNTVFGNKLAVLAGDFLLARASVCLARLRSLPVVELLSTVIEHLVKGEIMQMKTALRSEAATQAAFDLYLRKTYYKTGSLMANSCKAVAMLARQPDEVCAAAFRYGMHLGVAFQLVDDLLDFEGTSVSLGKPALADVRQGLATAPVLFAAHRFPGLLPAIERKFATPGDAEFAVRSVEAAGGVLLTRRLAVAHAQLALDAVAGLACSPARTGLAALARVVLSRKR